MTAWSLTWVCQGAVLASMALAAIRLLPRLGAATRYGIWWSALGLTAAAGVWTLPLSPASKSASSVSSSALEPIHLLVVPSAPRVLVAVLIGVWAAIVLVKLIRLVAAIHSVHRLRDSCVPMPSTIETELPLWLELRDRGRRAKLMVGDGVAGATVLGFFGPYIAIPAFLIQELTRHELDLVILHERAHVQRRDDWLTLAQEMMLAPLWMHPVAVFVSRQLGREREIACDEWVIARTEQPRTYARCLTHAAEVQRRGGHVRLTPQLLLGPTLMLKRIELAQRVDRLLAHRAPVPRRLSVWGLSSVACTLMAVASIVGALPLVGELGEVIVPVVTAPAARIGELVAARALPQVVPAPTPPPRSTRPSVPRQMASISATSTVPASSGGHDAPSASPGETNTAEGEPAMLSSKTFAALHSIVPGAAARTVVRERTPWQKTSNASVRFAEGLTRAGTSLARRF